MELPMNNDEMIAHVKAQLMKAEQLRAAGRKSELLVVLRQMLALQATGTFWGNVAQLFSGASDLDGAAKAARKFVTTCPDDLQAKALLANILGDLGKLGEAVSLAKQVVNHLPDVAQAHYNLGVLQSRNNQIAKARKSFTKAVTLDPDDALSLEYLAYLGKGEPSDIPLAATNQALARGNHTGKPAEAALHYARATLLGREGNWTDAFNAYENGAGLMRSFARTDLHAMDRFVERLKRSFSKQFFNENSAQRYKNKRPICVVGVPRSGTTLVESVLAAHSGVVAGGETTLLSMATMPFGSFEPVDLARIAANTADGQTPWRNMGQELKRLLKERFGSNLRVTEKNLGHHFLLGAVAMIAAGAPIIYCRRDPVATAWSCYKTRFLRGNGWSYDFNSIAHYQRLYADLMEHWQTVLPGAPILDVQYEDLVAYPDQEIRRILAHSGLKFESACLSPHKADMAVITASLAEVREPIHADANRAWQHYEPWLAPYLDNLRSS